MLKIPKSIPVCQFFRGRKNILSSLITSYRDQRCIVDHYGYDKKNLSWVGGFLLFLLFILHCQNFPPVFPYEKPEKETVIIEHASTEYLPIQQSSEGLVTSKVNVLFFRIQAKNFEAKSLEIFGRVVLTGPPENHSHCIHFRTDKIPRTPEREGIVFNNLEIIKPESSYTLVRYKYPTNEYSPFHDNQGMVKEINITEIWAIDELGQKRSVCVENITN